MPDPELSLRVGNAERRIAALSERVDTCLAALEEAHEAGCVAAKTAGGGGGGVCSQPAAPLASPDPEGGPEHVTCPTCRGVPWTEADERTRAAVVAGALPSRCGRCGGKGRLRVWVRADDGTRWVFDRQGQPRKGETYLDTNGEESWPCRADLADHGPDFCMTDMPCPGHPILVPAPAPEEPEGEGGTRVRRCACSVSGGWMERQDCPITEHHPPASSGGSPERPDWCEAVEELDRRLYRLTRVLAHALGGESPMRREVALQRLYDLAPGKGLHPCHVPGCEVLPDVIHEHSEPKTGGSYWDNLLDPTPSWKSTITTSGALHNLTEGDGE